MTKRTLAVLSAFALSFGCVETTCQCGNAEDAGRVEQKSSQEEDPETDADVDLKGTP